MKHLFGTAKPKPPPAPKPPSLEETSGNVILHSFLLM